MSARPRARAVLPSLPAHPALAPSSTTPPTSAQMKKGGIAEENKAQDQNPRPIENKEGEKMGRKRTSAGQRVHRCLRILLVQGGVLALLRLGRGRRVIRGCLVRRGLDDGEAPGRMQRGRAILALPAAYARRRCRHPGRRGDGRVVRGAIPRHAVLV
ncbi:hypothetical protein DFH09DRAFT_1193033 [Mycena vulgaris]|nr:hypothetical protein DFH09DRAFT_1193033 [Mycena vulgaris]